MREEEKVAQMPDLVTPRNGFAHTVDSTLIALARLGLAPERITINKAGRGWRRRKIVGQWPAAGKPLSADVMVELQVEGDGLFDYLPSGMREVTNDGEIGTAEVSSLFDDGVEKAAFYIRQGGLFFDVRPENRAGCERWIKLFGINPDNWPEGKWYQLSLLLPCLRYLAGLEKGLRLAMKLLVDVEVYSIGWQPGWTAVAVEDQSRLGNRSCRLGVDMIVGDGLDDEAELRITLGPITLERYYHLRMEKSEQLLDEVMKLVLPGQCVASINWLVEDINRAPSLGEKQRNSVLGVNMHLGWQK